MFLQQYIELWSLDKEQELHDKLFPLKESSAKDYHSVRESVIKEYSLKYKCSEQAIDLKLSQLGL